MVDAKTESEAKEHAYEGSQERLTVFRTARAFFLSKFSVLVLATPLALFFLSFAWANDEVSSSTVYAEFSSVFLGTSFTSGIVAAVLTLIVAASISGLGVIHSTRDSEQEHTEVLNKKDLLERFCLWVSVIYLFTVSMLAGLVAGSEIWLSGNDENYDSVVDMKLVSDFIKSALFGIIIAAAVAILYQQELVEKAKEAVAIRNRKAEARRVAEKHSSSAPGVDLDHIRCNFLYGETSSGLLNLAIPPILFCVIVAGIYGLNEVVSEDDGIATDRGFWDFVVLSALVVLVGLVFQYFFCWITVRLQFGLIKSKNSWFSDFKYSGLAIKVQDPGSTASSGMTNLMMWGFTILIGSSFSAIMTSTAVSGLDSSFVPWLVFFGNVGVFVAFLIVINRSMVVLGADDFDERALIYNVGRVSKFLWGRHFILENSQKVWNTCFDKMTIEEDD